MAERRAPHTGRRGSHAAVADQRTAGCSAAPVIEARGLVAGYDGAPAVNGIDLALPGRSLVAIIGPNGAGKSTLMKLFIGVLQPRAGELEVFGTPVHEQRRRGRLAYMPQSEQIDWDYPVRVRDVVMAARFGHIRREGGLRRFLPQGFAAGHHQRAVVEALDAVDMTEFSERPIGALSGGQKKRVLLARAIAQEAELLLLDEPLVGVDPASEALVLRVLGQLRNAGRSIVMVTHDLPSARAHADHVLLFNRTVIGEGRPEEVLTDELLRQTTDPALILSRPDAYTG